MRKQSEKTMKLVAIAMFSALAFVTTALCGYFPKVAGFLSLELKDSIIVICSLIFGPLSGLFIAILVPIIESFTISITGWYGLLMNVLSSATFVLVTGLIYRYKRTLYGAVVGLVAGVFSVTAVMLLANLLITPLYLTMIGVPTTVGDVAKMIPTILLPFNFIKATLNGSVVLLLYKPISSAMRKSGFLPKKENQGRDTRNKIRSFWITLIALTVIIVSFLIIFLVLT